MAIMYALVLLMASSVLLAAARKERAETVFPALLLFVISVLFPFYCFDHLRLGRILAYLVIFLIGVISAGCILKQKRPLFPSVLAALTPGVFLFAAYCGFVFVYTKGNLVGLWDEMRLWGAVPKALYFTDSLQMGQQSLIFASMQPYPPGMPLLVYFMESLSPQFSESYIFVTYGIFFGAMLLPALSNLRWKHWYLFLPLLVLLALAPCLLTSHGGDDGWFYESLFIDPILGALAGYAFYLAAGQPFATVFSVCRFGAALLALTVIKDSGALFAVFAVVCAVVLYSAEEESHRTCGRVLTCSGMAILPVLLGYGLWRYTLMSYGIGSNESGFMKWELSWESLGVLWQKLMEMPMLNLQAPVFRTQISLTYLPCLMGLLLLSNFCGKQAGKKELARHRITWIVMILSFLVFLVGYRLSFRGSLPSFQRYVSTTLTCAMAYGILQGIPALLENGCGMNLSGGWPRKIILMGVCIFFVISGCLFLGQWKTKKYDMTYTQAPAKMAARKILQTVEESTEEPADIYVLIADQPRQKSLVHHRIYYELLGTNACVRNFWNDVNIVGGEETPETWTQDEITVIADRWAAKLRDSGYDYVYVALANDFASAVFAEFGISEVSVGDLFAVVDADGILTIKKV